MWWILKSQNNRLMFEKIRIKQCICQERNKESRLYSILYSIENRIKYPRKKQLLLQKKKDIIKDVRGK